MQQILSYLEKVSMTLSQPPPPATAEYHANSTEIVVSVLEVG